MPPLMKNEGMGIASRGLIQENFPVARRVAGVAGAIRTSATETDTRFCIHFDTPHKEQ